MIEVGEIGFSYEPGTVRRHNEASEELGRRKVDTLRLLEARIGRTRIHNETQLIRVWFWHSEQTVDRARPGGEREKTNRVHASKEGDVLCVRTHNMRARRRGWQKRTGNDRRGRRIEGRERRRKQRKHVCCWC